MPTQQSRDGSELSPLCQGHLQKGTGHSEVVGQFLTQRDYERRCLGWFVYRNRDIKVLTTTTMIQEKGEGTGGEGGAEGVAFCPWHPGRTGAPVGADMAATQGGSEMGLQTVRGGELELRASDGPSMGSGLWHFYASYT